MEQIRMNERPDEAWISQKMRQELEAGIGVLRRDIFCLSQKIPSAEPQAKAFLIDEKIAVLNTGDVAIVGFYSDGHQKIETLFLDIRGPWSIYTICVEEDWQVPLFGIHFEGSDDWIIGQYTKIRNGYFYDLLVRFGVQFRTQIKRSTIMRVLHEDFSSALFMTSGSWKTSALAGWNGNKFQYKGNYHLKIQEGVSHFPVFQKDFEVLEYTEESAQKYFREMRCIKNEKDRLMIMIYPFLCIVSSILARFGNPMNFGLSIIDLGGMDKQRICGWQQIFNRNVCMPLGCGMTEKQFQKLLKTVKDEIIMLDNTKSSEDTYYRKCEKERRILSAVHTILGENRLEGRVSDTVHAGVIVFSGQFQKGREFYNVYASDEWCYGERGGFRESKVMERIFSDYVKCVEREMEKFEEIIKKHRPFKDRRAQIVSIGWDLVNYYWARKGINFKKFAGLRKEIDFAGFFEEASYDEEELKGLFIRSFRRGAENFFFQEKELKRKSNDTIYYTSKFLWIPVGIFNSILEREGIKQYKNQILEQLKRERVLEVDNEGLSKRIMVDGQREEMYQIDRKIFQTDISYLDIIELGRENDVSR